MGVNLVVSGRVIQWEVFIPFQSTNTFILTYNRRIKSGCAAGNRHFIVAMTYYVTATGAGRVVPRNKLVNKSVNRDTKSTVVMAKKVSPSSVIKKSTSSAARSLRSLGSKISSGIKSIPGAVKNDVKALGNVVSSGVRTVGQKELEVVNRIASSKPVSVITQAPVKVMNTVSGVAHDIVSAPGKAMNSVETFTNNVVEQVTNIPARLADDAKDVLNSIENAITGTVNTGVNRVKTRVGNRVNRVETNLHNLISAGTNRAAAARDRIEARVNMAENRVSSAIGATVDRAKDTKNRLIGNVRRAGVHVIDTGRSVLTDVRTGIRKKLLVVVIGITVVGFLLWDNTRSQRAGIARFIEREGGAALQTLAREGPRAVRFAMPV